MSFSVISTLFFEMGSLIESGNSAKLVVQQAPEMLLSPPAKLGIAGACHHVQLFLL